MIYLRRVVGQSMMPSLKPGQLCVFMWRRHFHDGDVVLAVAGGRPVVKRASRQDGYWELRGDNRLASNTYVVMPGSHTTKLLGKLIFPRVGSIISQS